MNCCWLLHAQLQDSPSYLLNEIKSSAEAHILSLSNLQAWQDVAKVL